jgi:hypothetical protein
MYLMYGVKCKESEVMEIMERIFPDTFGNEFTSLYGTDFLHCSECWEGANEGVCYLGYQGKYLEIETEAFGEKLTDLTNDLRSHERCWHPKYDKLFDELFYKYSPTIYLLNYFF